MFVTSQDTRTFQDVRISTDSRMSADSGTSADSMMSQAPMNNGFVRCSYCSWPGLLLKEDKIYHTKFQHGNISFLCSLCNGLFETGMQVEKHIYEVHRIQSSSDIKGLFKIPPITSLFWRVCNVTSCSSLYTMHEESVRRHLEIDHFIPPENLEKASELMMGLRCRLCDVLIKSGEQIEHLEAHGIKTNEEEVKVMQSKEIDWKEEGKELTKEEKEMSEVEIVKELEEGELPASNPNCLRKSRSPEFLSTAKKRKKNKDLQKELEKRKKRCTKKVKKILKYTNKENRLTSRSGTPSPPPPKTMSKTPTIKKVNSTLTLSVGSSPLRATRTPSQSPIKRKSRRSLTISVSPERKPCSLPKSVSKSQEFSVKSSLKSSGRKSFPCITVSSSSSVSNSPMRRSRSKRSARKSLNYLSSSSESQSCERRTTQSKTAPGVQRRQLRPRRISTSSDQQRSVSRSPRFRQSESNASERQPRPRRSSSNTPRRRSSRSVCRSRSKPLSETESNFKRSVYKPYKRTDSRSPKRLSLSRESRKRSHTQTSLSGSPFKRFRSSSENSKRRSSRSVSRTPERRSTCKRSSTRSCERPLRSSRYRKNERKSRCYSPEIPRRQINRSRKSRLHHRTSLDDSEYSDESSPHRTESSNSTDFISNIKSILLFVKKPKRDEAHAPNTVKKTFKSKSPSPVPSTAARKAPESEGPVSLPSSAARKAPESEDPVSLPSTAARKAPKSEGPLSLPSSAARKVPESAGLVSLPSTTDKEVLKLESHASSLYPSTSIPEVQNSRNGNPPQFLTSLEVPEKIFNNLKTPLIPRALYVKGLSTITVTPEAAKSCLVSNSSTSVISMKAATNLDPSFSGASTSKSIPSESSSSFNGSSQNCLPASNALPVPPTEFILPLKSPTAKSTRDLYLPPYKTRPSQYSFIPLENLKDVEDIRTKEKPKDEHVHMVHTAGKMKKQIHQFPNSRIFCPFYKCRADKQSFADIEDLRKHFNFRHQRNGIMDGLIRCGDCSKKGYSNDLNFKYSDFIKHLKIVHQAAGLEAKDFKYYAELSESSYGTVICTSCKDDCVGSPGFYLENKESRLARIRREHSEKHNQPSSLLLGCQLCSKSFPYPDHTEGWLAHLKECRRTTLAKPWQNTRINIITGDNPAVTGVVNSNENCKYCSESIPRKRISDHMETEHLNLMFRCNRCSDRNLQCSGFSRLSELKAHLESNHPLSKPWSKDILNPTQMSWLISVKCKICEWIGYSLDSARSHTKHESMVGEKDVYKFFSCYCRICNEYQIGKGESSESMKLHASLCHRSSPRK